VRRPFGTLTSHSLESFWLGCSSLQSAFLSVSDKMYVYGFDEMHGENAPRKPAAESSLCRLTVADERRVMCTCDQRNSTSPCIRCLAA
jgi:hypothetical protein